MSIMEEVTKKIVDMMETESPSYLEFTQSEIHDCGSRKDDFLTFFVTKDHKLKYIPTDTSGLSFPISQEVECCMWCGFKPVRVVL